MKKVTRGVWLALALAAGCGRVAFDSLGGVAGDGGPGAGADGDAASASGDGPVGDGPVGGSTVTYVQGGNATDSGPKNAISAPFFIGETAGNLNFIALTWDSGFSVTSITDTAGNTYQRVSFNATQNGLEHELWYAANIAGGATTLTVTFSGANTTIRLRFAEYAGLAKTSPLDVHTRGSGVSTAMTTPSIVTTNAHDFLIAANSTDSTTTAITPQFTQRPQLTLAGSIVEDREVTATGSYAASATGAASAAWLMELVAFRVGP